jgi:hypothetical protein
MLCGWSSRCLKGERGARLCGMLDQHHRCSVVLCCVHSISQVSSRCTRSLHHQREPPAQAPSGCALRRHRRRRRRRRLRQRSRVLQPRSIRSIMAGAAAANRCCCSPPSTYTQSRRYGAALFTRNHCGTSCRRVCHAHLRQRQRQRQRLCGHSA